jgi:UDP-N-acetylmuramyl pentapeptide phosphotransferase/UDP-N-acetylglucosamine-1-phosphate transferase
VVLLADIRISDMHGIFSIGVLPYWVSVGFSTVLIIFITNSFNLIDGIDGLVGVTALIVSLAFGLFFAYMGNPAFAGMAFTLTGASLGFLKFNVSPAKIFMGDAGSMLIGLVAAVLSIRFIELNIGGSVNPVYFAAAPAIGMAILIGPIFDAIRVFVLRLLKGQSPFVADNNHTHHRLLRLGFTHKQTSIILMSFNNLLLTMVIYFREMGNEVLITFLLVSCIAFNLGLTLLLKRDERKVLHTGKALTLKPTHISGSHTVTQLRSQSSNLAVEASHLKVRSEKTGT